MYVIRAKQPKVRKYPGKMRCRGGCGKMFFSPDRKTVDRCDRCRRVPPSRKGWVRCIGCERRFLSPDRLAIRQCPKCTREPERVGKSGERYCGVHGVEIPSGDDD